MTMREDFLPGLEGDPLRGCHIVLGVSGSIACYKALEMASQMVQVGAVVDVVMTPHATEFVRPLAFRSITGREPYVDMFSPQGDFGEPHVELARRADAMLIAPATASMIGRLAHGLADDFVSLTAIATTAPLLVAPAMDAQMWEHPATQANVALLRQRGVVFAGPTEGRLASGRIGSGRLSDPGEVVATLRALLARDHGDLNGRRIVVTAGGNREAIDPVRFIGNRSTGKMGYAIAAAARDRGAEVVLISTIDSLRVPATVRMIPVETHAQMYEAVLRESADADALIMAAAVADYSPANPLDHKIKRDQAGDLAIQLVENADIVASVPTQSSRGTLVKVAFAAETDDLLDNARLKLQKKGVRLIVANDVTATDAGFGSDDNRVTILDDQGGREDHPLMTKYAVGQVICDRLVSLFA